MFNCQCSFLFHTAFLMEMHVARINGPTTFEVVRTPVPRLREAGEVLIRTAACGICSGDLMPWYLDKKVGTVLGHEVVAWAVEVGEAVHHIRQGDLVFVHHHAPCLTCPECRQGRFVHCSTWRQSRLDPGGMAEWIRVPTVNALNDSFAVNDLTPEQAVFIEPLACSLKALDRIGRLLDLKDASTCGIIVGCGVMGLLNLAAARALGVSHLVAVEPDDGRRRLALDWGASRALTPVEADSSLRQWADFVMIGPGHPEVTQQGLRYVRPGGTALLFTPTATGVLTGLDLGELYFREVNLVPSYSCGPPNTTKAYELIRSKQVRPEGLVTHRFELRHVQEAYNTARMGGSALKVLVTFPQEAVP
jgi:L-iditol 2-dehydrogenase